MQDKRSDLAKFDRDIRCGPGQPLIPSIQSFADMGRRYPEVRQVESTKPNLGRAFFGSSTRPPLSFSDGDVGPGHYEGAQSIGVQSDSRKRSEGRATLKGVGRDKAAIGAKMSHDKGPGPQAYTVQSGINVTTSTKRASFAYGKASPAMGLSGRTKFGDPFAKW